MISVMVAVAILGLTINALLLTVSNSFKAQRILRLSGQIEDLRSVFRGSSVCQTRCTDQLKGFSRSISGWDIDPRCVGTSPRPRLMVRNKDYQNGEWVPLYKPNQEVLICKQGIALLPPLLKSVGERRVACARGQVMTGVDFVNRTVVCASDGTGH